MYCQGYLTALRASGAATSTIELRRFHLDRLDRDLPSGLDSATLEDLEEFLAGPFSRDYRRSLRASMRSYYRYRERSGLGPNIAADLAPVRPAPPRPRPTPERAVADALEAADDRARLMIRLAAEAGLRRAEIAAVAVEDLIEDLLGYSLITHGKGNKDRIVPVSDSLAREIRCYSAGPGFLFPSPRGGHMTPAHVGKIISRLLPAGITPHSLRHRFATRAYSRSSDLLAVQQLLGHASPATTQRYVEVDSDRLRRAALAA